MSRLLFVLRNFPPDVGAPVYRLRHAAAVLGEEHDITVLCAQPNRYPGMDRAPAREELAGVRVFRVWNGELLDAGGKLGRAATEGLGALWTTAVALARFRDYDVVVVTSPPLFYLLPGLALHKLTGTPLVVDVRDLWLDWAEETGVVGSSLLLRALRRFERSALRSASGVTVATEAFGREIATRFGVPPDRITVIRNGLDDSMIPDRVEAAASKRPRKILYAGNLGPSQNLLGVAAGIQASLERWPDLEWTIVGAGSQWDALKELERPGLRVLERVDRQVLAGLYAEADVFLLHLAALKVYEHTVPSKIFEYGAFGKPLLCGVRGEARQICSDHTDCYYFEPDGADSLVAAVARLLEGAGPDNAAQPRGEPAQLLRSTRAPRWRAALAGALGG